jgi:pimeloyl-ACP methyl ester carboxylesterase
LVLLHGALSNIEVDFGRMLPAFARTRQVIAIEQQAHGHTADIGRPLTCEQMADDTAALLRHLEIEQSDFFGYSMGAGIALQVAMRQPDLVRKLILASVTYNSGGFHPGVLAGIGQIVPEMLAGTPFAEEYARIAPNPDDWPALIERVKELNGRVQDWLPGAIRELPAPTLLIYGDADQMRLEHAVELFGLFGGGVAGDMVGLPESRLAVLPATTYISLVHRAEWLISMIGEFLDAPMSETVRASDV